MIYYNRFLLKMKVENEKQSYFSFFTCKKRPNLLE